MTTTNKYHVASKWLHWISALIVVGLFSVGFWMVDLDYYSDWYKTAPHYHKSVGLLFAGLIVFRIITRLVTKTPATIASHAKWEVIAAKATHIIFYILLISIFVSGYLISTADGRGIDVFNWFTVPSVGEFIENQEDIAGEIHEYLAYGLIGLAVIHALAALKHHFVDKDATLKRML